MPTVNGFNTTQGILKYNAEKLENYNTPVFNSSTTYSLGDYTIYQGKLYKYISNTPSSGSWSANNWTFVVLTDEVKTLFNEIDTIEEEIPQPSDNNPLMNGIANSGISDDFSRADHVHPKDTSKQDKLIFDTAPTQNSGNPVTSGGVYATLAEKQNTLTFDNTPTDGSSNPVYSGGVYSSLEEKQDALTFDNTPTQDSQNPVTSDGIYESILKLYPVDTESGSIASFPDGADSVPVKSLLCTIAPVQDLHGYDSPWPAGGGINRLSPFTSEDFGGSTLSSDGLIVTTGTRTSNNLMRCSFSNSIEVVAENTYYISFDARLVSGTCTNFRSVTLVNSSNTSLFNYRTVVASPNLTATKQRYKFYTTGMTGGGTGVKLYIQGDNTDNAVVEISNVCISLAENYDYAPYSNICPISGYSGLTVTRTGKNLLDLSGMNSRVSGIDFVRNGSIITYSGTSTVNGYASFLSFYFPKPGTYRIHLDGDGIFLRGWTNLGKDRTETVSDVSQVYRLSTPSLTAMNQYSGTISNVQIELGSTATAYEPYQGNTYPISWQSEAGTVYGGTLDVTSGVLTVDRAYKAFSELVGWQYRASQFDVSISDGMPQAEAGKPSAFITDTYETKASGASGSYPNDTCAWQGISANQVLLLRVRDPSFTSVAEFLASRGSVNICFKLATPQTYQLTPTEIETLVGENVMWADCNGEVSVTYRADPSLFVDKKLSIIPDPPTSDGFYNLQVAVSSGISTYSWVSA